MKSLKDKLYNYSSDDFGHNTTPELDEVIDKVEEDVKEAVNDFNLFIETLLKENGITGLDDKDRKIIMEIMDKYQIKPVERDINKYKHILYIHKKIFGNYEE